MNLENIIYALLGGIMPALVWLWFWLREDKKDPEPKGLIEKTFFLGMLAVVLVLPFQKGVEMFWPGMAFQAVLVWAVLEEVFKLTAGYFGGLHSREDNEPLDPLVYMITAALGFVALENALFILGPLVGQDIPGSFITGNLRFIGASLLHVVSSGLIGASLAFSFYKPRAERIKSVAWALVAAVILHTLFNVLIITFKNNGTLMAFATVWIGVGYILWAFERAKSVRL